MNRMPQRHLRNPLLFCLVSLVVAGTPLSANTNADLLRQLVNINSGTNNIRGVNKLQKIVAARLAKLGFKTTFKQNPLGRTQSSDLLVATLKGKNPAFITLVIHTDTVYEPGTKPDRFKILSDGKTAIGPGSLDDKGGIVVLLSGLQTYLSQTRPPETSLRVVSSPSEETGSAGFHDDFRKFAEDSVMVLGFEPASADGSITESQRGNRWYQIRVEGIEAHAGSGHHNGVNACHELAIKLDKLQKLTDYSHNVTVNIGHMEGGKDKFNIVCGFAKAKVDARFADFESRDALHREIEKILAETYVRSADGTIPTKTTYLLDDDCPPFAGTPESRPFLAKYLDIIASIEKREVHSEKAGGAADSNYMSRKGLIVIDSLGPYGGGIHTPDESVFLPSLETRAQALADFLAYAGDKLRK